MTNDPLYPIADWQHEVANGDTKLGYVEWVTHQKEMNASDEDDGPILRRYGVRLWATFRAVAETEVEAFSFESAVEKAKGISHHDFLYKIEDGAEGDETTHVFGPADEAPEDDDPWAGDGVEIDKRTDGEPFSWAACQIVKDLAKLHDFSNPTFGTEQVKALIKRAHEACQKEG